MGIKSNFICKPQNTNYKLFYWAFTNCRGSVWGKKPIPLWATVKTNNFILYPHNNIKLKNTL